MKDKQRHTLMCPPTHAHMSKIDSTNSEPEKKTRNERFKRHILMCPLDTYTQTFQGEIVLI